jgi:SAM-dependent methyltransferase
MVIAAVFAFAGLKGAPYVPILGRDSQALLKLAHLKPGQTLMDLGSGDGRLLSEAAAKGIKGIGYEINPFMVWISRIVCWRYRNLVTIHLADLWHTTLPPADVVYVFLMPRHMDKLHKYFTAQLRRPTRVISYAFEIPGAELIDRSHNTYVYQYGKQP